MIKNHYSLSLINKLLDWLDDFIMFSKIDLWNAYHCICICEEDEWKTAFCTQYDYFEFLVVLFDLTNVSVIFQVYINHALCELVDDFCIVYLDDILIFSRIKAEHFHHLEHVIKCLWHAELYVNSKKCEFFKTEVEYLDFVIDKESIWMNSAHVKTVSEWSYSKSYQDIQVFLEFCNFYWCFIYNFSDIVKSLQDLLWELKNNKKLNLIIDYKWQIF